MNPHAFQRAVLNWFNKHGRKHLPWQQNPTPYRVWISEIMLQQTQVTTVIPYFEKFISRFPTVQSLAKASEDNVLHLWTGLGYYSRARNILKTAKIIAKQYKNKFPDTLLELEALPGIGRSTAAAILSLSMQKRATILDGNVKRVLSRVSALTAWKNERKLWEIAEQLTPHQKIAEYTQAMMDLGAIVCTRSKPGCLICPLQKLCLAFQQQRQSKFPGTKPSKTLPIKQIQLLIIKNQHNEILLEKRPSRGIWGGLWSLPEHPEDSIESYCKKIHGKVKFTHQHPPFRHTFTHFHLDITPIEVKVTTNDQKPINLPLRWHNSAKAVTFGLAAPIKKLLTLKT